MIDGIKLSAEIVTSLDSWRNKTGINLTTKVDSQSGNQLVKERTENNFTQRTIQYSGSFQNYNLSIKQVHKITPNAEVIDERTFLSINGSLHCNYHRGNNIETLLLDLKHTQNEQREQTETDELFTVQDTAKFLRLSVPTVYALISKGELPVMKRSKRCYFSKVELINYLKQGRKKTLAEIASEAEQYIKTKKG